ncbi:hypothetical protein BDF22DRAFT_49645 [Syncephalis plumigaleata]|nr:hypothetical protein BDF22DRAFT_49645 [Syncephalis plumigaleata]
MAHPMLRMIWQSGYWTSKVLPQECYNVYSKPLLVYMQNYPRDGHWKIYATDSASSSGLGDPFGVLQWSTVDDTATDIQLVILPYNYPQLSAILEDKSDTRIDAAINYIANIPCYYRKYAIQLFRQHDILINRVPVSIDELSPRVFQQISHIIDTTKTIVNAKKRVQINPFDVAINEMDTRLAELQVSLLKEVPGFSTVRIKWPEWGTNLSPCITYGDHLTPIASPVFPSVIMASTTTTDMDMDMEIDVQVALEDTAISDITSDKRDMTTTTSSVPLTKANNDTTTNESIIPSKRVNEHEVDSTESGVSASKMARLEMNTDKSSRTVANTAGTSTTTTMKATALPESTKKEITPSNNGASKVSTDVVASTATTSTVTKPVKPIKPAVATPPLEAYNDVKTRLVKHIKQGRKQYNENEIIDELGRLIKTKGYTRDQKRSILAGCLLAARTMKRKTLIETLDQLKAKLD